jgi:hypothetical protein
MDLLIVFSQVGLDLWQVAFLLVVAHLQLTGKLFAGRLIILVRMLPDVEMIGISMFQQGPVVQFAAACQRPEQLLLLLLVRIQSELESLPIHVVVLRCTSSPVREGLPL